MPADRNGSGSYQSLAPLPANDRVQRPFASSTGDRPFLPPTGYPPPAQVERGLDRPAQEPSVVRDEDSEPTNPLPVILPGALPGDLAGPTPRALPAPVPGDLPGPTPRALPAPVPGDLAGPLPLNLPGAASIPRPAQIEAPRGPFEPARPARQTSITGSVEPPPPPANGGHRPAGSFQNAAPGQPAIPAAGSRSPRPDELAPPVGAPPGHSTPQAASAKLEQIKDLYLTAEAIGEDALDKHFDQVSQRQRELIKEFFERSHPEDGDRQ